MNRKWAIYTHKNPTTQQVFYVGIGKNKRRPFEKFNRSERWVNYVSKYGKPVVEIIGYADTLEDALKIEASLIERYGRYKIDEGGILMNISEGGRGCSGVKWSEEKRLSHIQALKGRSWGNHTEEFKRALSEAKKGKRLPQLAYDVMKKRYEDGLHPCRGRKLTDAHKQRLSDLRTGKPLPVETREKIRAANLSMNNPNRGRKRSDEFKQQCSSRRKGKYTGGENANSKKVIDTQSGIIYSSIKDAAQSLGLTYGYLKSRINGFLPNNSTLTRYDG